MKRLILIFVIIISLALLTTGGYALDVPKIAGLNSEFWSNSSSFVFLHIKAGGVETPVEASGISVKPGNELRLVLKPSDFVNSQGVTMDQYGLDNVTLSQITDAGISVKSRTVTGAQALGEISLKNGKDKDANAYISIKFADELVSTRETDFDIIISVPVEGQKNNIMEFKVSGKISNPVFIVPQNDTFVDISDGAVMEAPSYIKNMQVNIGNGISILTNLFEGSRYYGTSKVEIWSEGALLENCPEVKLIYTLRTIGLKKEGRKCVSFDLNENYYVYSANGDYLGTTAEPVLFSAKYYLTQKKIDRIDLPDEMM